MTPDRTETLIHMMLDRSLSEAERIELNDLLRGSRAARESYLTAIAIHGALIRKCAAAPFSLPFAVPPIAAKPLRFPFRTLLAIAAGIVLAAGAFFAKPGARADITDGDFTVSPGATPLAFGKIPARTPLSIASGSLTLTYPSGAQVLLEAPCHFQLDEKEALTLVHGRGSVYAPPGAQGFVLDTPSGKFIDLGTRFGVAVGSDGSDAVILSEVFEGEVNIETPSEPMRLLRNGDSTAILSSGRSSRLVDSLDSSPIHLSRSASNAPVDGKNLALGKPVFSPGYCVRPHGSIFPPDNLTDGRLNDSGVPGDWSFWLAPDFENGEFTVDLMQDEIISRISLQNTSNRFINDRGTENFAIEISSDNKSFTPLIVGTLPRIEPDKPEQSFPFHEFSFPETTARYVRFIVLSHYRHPANPSHRHHSGGLSEIRIFR